MVRNQSTTIIVNATYQVVTPMYLGGANQSPEFRLSSYAHLLRWWWRFLALDRFGGERNATFWESVLFGWHKEPFGRKRVSFRLMQLSPNGDLKDWGAASNWGKQWSGLSYLTAQGFKNRKAVPVASFQFEARIKALDVDSLRTSIERQRRGSSIDFDVSLESWHRAIHILIDAIAVFGLLGGMGARTRRGFGSLTISSLVVKWPVDTDGEQQRDETLIGDIPCDVAEYRNLIQRHLKGVVPYEQRLPAIILPPYSAFSSNHFDYKLCAIGEDAQELMNDIGWAFQVYRSWGVKQEREATESQYYHVLYKDKKHHQLEAGRNKRWYKQQFIADHDEFYKKKLIGSSRKEIFDNRAIFGLPHNYGQHQVGWDELRSIPGEVAHNRRASPLLFHFHRLKTGQTVFVAIVITARFAPPEARLRVKNQLCGGLGFDSETLNWSLLNCFATFLRKPHTSVKDDECDGVKFTSYKVVPEE